MSNLNIPIDFLEKKGSELFKVQGGFAFKSGDYSENGYFLIRIGNVGKGRFDYKDPVYVKVKSTRVLDNFLIKENDVLMGLTGDLGKICFVEKAHNLVLNQRVARFLNDEKLIDKKYLYYLISSEEVQETFESFFAGGAQKNISPKKIEEVRYLLPSNINEQKKIAEILTKVDEAIENTEQLIQKYEQVKVGLMQDLLTKGIDENGNIRSEETHQFKDSPLGRIPVEWEVKNIDEITSLVRSGVTPRGGSNVYGHNGVIFLRSQNVYPNRFKLDDVAFISDSINIRMKGSQLETYDILLNITGASIGRSNYVPENFPTANVNQHVCLIRLKEPSQIRSYFISSFLNSNQGQNQIIQFNSGGNREGLNYKQIRDFVLPWFNKNYEFEYFYKYLNNIDSVINQQLISLNKLKHKKQGLMQDLLSGKVRVNY